LEGQKGLGKLGWKDRRRGIKGSRGGSEDFKARERLGEAIGDRGKYLKDVQRGLEKRGRSKKRWGGGSSERDLHWDLYWWGKGREKRKEGGIDRGKKKLRWWYGITKETEGN